MSSSRARAIIGVLMESTLYFELTLKERMALVKHLLKNSSLAEEETSEPALVGQYQPVERV
jgi:hypothetical protein